MSGNGNNEAFNKAVTLIIGSLCKPDWLDGRMRQMVRTIRAWRESEALAPTRKEMRAKLDGFRDAVLTLKDGVTDPGFEVFIGRDWSATTGVSYAQLMSCFDELSMRAHNASSRLAGKGGTAIAFPTDTNKTISAQQLCAWTVKHAILFTRTEHFRKLGCPVPHNMLTVGPDLVDAQNAANQLWKAAGGVPYPIKDGNLSPTSWRDHFMAVAEAESDGDMRSASLRSMLDGFSGMVLVEMDETD